MPLSLGVVGSHQCPYLFPVAEEHAINMMRPVLIGQVDEVGTQFAHRHALIGEVLDADGTGHRQVRLRLENVEVAIGDTSHIRHIRQLRHDARQVEFSHCQRQVLQGFAVVIIGIHLYQHAVVGLQFEVCRQAFVVTQIDIVVLVCREWDVSQNGIVPGEVHHDSILFDGGDSTKVKGQSVVLIVELDIGICSLLEDGAIDIGVKAILRIVGAVANPCVVFESRAVGEDGKIDAVELYAVGYEMVDCNMSVETVDMR